MTAFHWQCFAFAVLLTTVVIALRRNGFLHFEVRIPDPEPEPVSDAEVASTPAPASDSRLDASPPAWLTELAALGFRTFESADTSQFGATAPQPEYTICVSRPHPYEFCGACRTKSVRMLGETPLFAENGSDRISWVGCACGRCGYVELTTNPNAARFLSLMLFDSRSMLTMVAQAKPHAGKTLNEIITAMMLQNEGALQARINRSAGLRAGMPIEKLAKVLLFKKGRKPKKRKRDLL